MLFLSFFFSFFLTSEENGLLKVNYIPLVAWFPRLPIGEITGLSLTKDLKKKEERKEKEKKKKKERNICLLPTGLVSSAIMLAAVQKGDAKELAELIRQHPGFDTRRSELPRLRQNRFCCLSNKKQTDFTRKTTQ